MSLQFHRVLLLKGPGVKTRFPGQLIFPTLTSSLNFCLHFHLCALAVTTSPVIYQLHHVGRCTLSVVHFGSSDNGIRMPNNQLCILQVGAVSDIYKTALEGLRCRCCQQIAFFLSCVCCFLCQNCTYTITNCRGTFNHEAIEPCRSFKHFVRLPSITLSFNFVYVGKEPARINHSLGSEQCSVIYQE